MYQWFRTDKLGLFITAINFTVIDRWQRLTVVVLENEICYYAIAELLNPATIVVTIEFPVYEY